MTIHCADWTPADHRDSCRRFLEQIGLPEEGCRSLLAVLDQIGASDAHWQTLLTLTGRYLADPCGAGEAVRRAADALAGQLGASPYAVHYVLLTSCARGLADIYREAGLPEDLYWASMEDLRWKAAECRQMYGVWGTFVFDWYARFFDASRFTLGRLQFETVPFACDRFQHGGQEVRRGDTVLNIHIPSSGPLTGALCLDAYRRAHTFYTARSRTRSPSVFVCDSWLLCPDNPRFLPETSRIREFMAPFTILERRGEEEVFADGWRVFGPAFRPPFDALPRDTSLQRACADWLQQGHRIGRGYGAFVFDGEKVL